MRLNAYKWGWFGSAMSRAIWGWTGGKIPVGGFTPRISVPAAVFKAAPTLENGVSVKERRLMGAARRTFSAGLIHNTNAPAIRVSLPARDATASRSGTKMDKRANAGSLMGKSEQRPKRARAARVVNKTKKP